MSNCPGDKQENEFSQKKSLDKARNFHGILISWFFKKKIEFRGISISQISRITTFQGI